ncbi:FAD-dependent monooxygenase [Agrobacterium rubi]|uniref:FAD-binding monooxygenase n=1 Tax=Agrobacterium rubi TaxID=28099 RepID=A0AAE7UR60_9HYPH|nr:FAD-dependent monooxygenase [Agrobacterium rubi]NTE89464.1 FAD-binding monooxygenase [Agrobacterium rubi]NTF05601.1 FAD-binding monooxygenase [Agrobacterium rubi]NTF39601.1 FAD-binding monooxygenase [Agrobacterium rubi]OCJ51057.1 FAD-binding monooxygenase [Agrobacterium rubi]QTG03608.1 FAD-binding monooxygenase [Agrobacterium rubi]
MANRILITGASIAGTTAAWWLSRYGFDVTVVERTPEFRDGGQNIDVRGVGRDVLRRMGLEQSALERGTGEEGTVWVDEDGESVARFVTDELGSDGPTAEMEILRGDLARLLYEPAQEQAVFRFGDHIKRIEDGFDSVTVTFASGKAEKYDAVIIAEGVGSSTRKLVFPNENEPRWMDLTIAYFTIPRQADDDRMWRWYNATEGRSISLRPDMHGTTRAMLSIQQPANGEQDWSVEEQKAYLHKRFEDAGWQAPRVLSHMQDTTDFYFDVLRQIHMKRWSTGRIVLTGDAAWCATPLAGIGATLAVTGAYVLASEIKLRSTKMVEAFSSYEKAMRPMVKNGQGVPKIAPRIMNPKTRLGINLLHGVLNVASKPGIRDVAAKLFASEPEGPAFSPYDALVNDGNPL